jgi:hypothetical protein
MGEVVGPDHDIWTNDFDEEEKYMSEHAYYLSHSE